MIPFTRENTENMNLTSR